MKLFRDLVVVEIAGSIAGAYATKLFSDFGARVVKVEPPGGDSSRWTGPLTRTGQSTEFAYLNTGKASLGIDASSRTGREVLRKLCSQADVLVESFCPGPANPIDDEITRHSQLIRARVSPFGLTGPYAQYRSTPFTDFAVAGHMYLTGEPDREPLQGAPNQSLYASGTHAFIGCLAAIVARENNGPGQDIDVSHFEVMASLHQWTTVRFTHGGVIQRRVGNRYGSLHPSTIYQCRDGYVAFAAVGNESLGRFLSLIEMDHLLEDPRFVSGAARFTNADEFDAIIEPWMMDHSVDEVVQMGQAVRAPVAPVNTPEDLLRDAHLQARDFWVTPAGIAGNPKYPGPPFRMSDHQWSLHPAPGIGVGSAPWVQNLTADGTLLELAGIVRTDPNGDS